jgi:hypothetical protein
MVCNGTLLPSMKKTGTAVKNNKKPVIAVE